METKGTPYAALTRYLRSLGPDVTSRSYTFGELHAALSFCRVVKGRSSLRTGG